LILNQAAGAIAVNAFHVGGMIERQLRVLVGTGLRTIEPALTALHAHGQTDRLRKAYLRGGRLTLWIGLAVATPLIVFRTELLSLYLGPAFDEYPQAATVLAILLVAYVLRSSNAMLGRIARAQANVGPVTRRSLTMELSNLTLTLVLVVGLGYGAVACALATLVTIAIALPTFFWPMAKRLTGVRRRGILTKILTPALTPALAAGALGQGLRLWHTPQSWLTLLAMAGAVFVAYGLVLLAIMPAADRADLRRVVNLIPRLGR
jgi:O-antigen/teichoic acid export membrane protein